MHSYPSDVADDLKNVTAKHSKEETPCFVTDAVVDLGEYEKGVTSEEEGVAAQVGNIHSHDDVCERNHPENRVTNL